MYTVGQQILDGRAVIASIDTDGKIITVEFPSFEGQLDGPLTVTYNYGVTEAFVANAAGQL